MMANAMLKSDEFPTSTSSVDWLSMCASSSDSSINPNPNMHDNRNNTTTSNSTTNMKSPSYDKMLGGMSTTTISNLNQSGNPSVSFSIDTILKPNTSSLTILPSPLTTSNTSNKNKANTGTNTGTSSTASNMLPQRKSVDFANLPPPSPKRVRQQIISLATFPSSNLKAKWTTQQIVQGKFFGGCCCTFFPSSLLVQEVNS